MGQLDYSNLHMYATFQIPALALRMYAHQTINLQIVHW